MAKKGCNCDDCDEDRKHAAELAIRADERAKIVAYLRAEADETITIDEKATLRLFATRIARGDDTKPGQPKEGGQ
jgi:hypothetical protein